MRGERERERTRYRTCNGAPVFPFHFLWAQLRFASLDSYVSRSHCTRLSYTRARARARIGLHSFGTLSNIPRRNDFAPQSAAKSVAGVEFCEIIAAASILHDTLNEEGQCKKENTRKTRPHVARRLLSREVRRNGSPRRIFALTATFIQQRRHSFFRRRNGIRADDLLAAIAWFPRERKGKKTRAGRNLIQV